MKDYQAIASATTGVLATQMVTNLYNGNISTMSTNTPAFANEGKQASFTKQFTYDQLNRIKTAQVIGSDNSFGTAYSYDANGNIKTLERRNGAGVVFDQLSYNYHNVDKGYLKNTNKLRSVNDLVSTQEGGKALHGEDIEDQGIDNYSYDEIGNLIADESEEIERIEWTVSGKVFAVIRKANSTKANLYFSYDAMGNRISKKSVDPKLGNVHTTYYFREANGNTMATYEKAPNNSFTLSEQHIYGSSRLGMFTPVTSSNVHSTIKGDINKGNYLIGNRSYEFSDHLGNVHLVLNDKNVALSATEYYPFGMVMQTYSPSEYRYGFNGKELDIEGMGGGGATYDYGFRIYNPQIAKFLSVDPLSPSYPWYTPYQFAGNKPIVAVDLDGLEENVVITHHYTDGTKKQTVLHASGIVLNGKAAEYVKMNFLKQYAPSGDLTLNSESGSLVNLSSGAVTKGTLFIDITDLQGEGRVNETLFSYTEKSYDQIKTEEKAQEIPQKEASAQPFTPTVTEETIGDKVGEFEGSVDNFIKEKLSSAGVPENDPDAVKFGVNVSLAGGNVGGGYATNQTEGGVYLQFDFNPNTNPTALGVTVGAEMLYFTKHATDRSLAGAVFR